jgi:hypothetical protein
MRTVIDSDSAPLRRSIDALFEIYVSWREACHAVRQAYERWADSDRGQRGLAYPEYVAALDREEHVARAYEHQIERTSRMCRDAERASPVAIG